MAQQSAVTLAPSGLHPVKAHSDGGGGHLAVVPLVNLTPWCAVPPGINSLPFSFHFQDEVTSQLKKTVNPLRNQIPSHRKVGEATKITNGYVRPHGSLFFSTCLCLCAVGYSSPPGWLGFYVFRHGLKPRGQRCATWDTTKPGAWVWPARGGVPLQGALGPSTWSALMQRGRSTTPFPPVIWCSGTTVARR